MEAIGRSGGIWLLWNDNVVVTVLRKNKQFSHVPVEYGNDSFLFTAIYAGCIDKEFFERAGGFQYYSSLAALPAGDFNAILSPNERVLS